MKIIKRFGAQALFYCTLSRLGICISAPEFSHQPSKSTFSSQNRTSTLPIFKKNLPGCSRLPIPPLMNCILHYDKSSASEHLHVHLINPRCLPTSLVYTYLSKTEMTKKTRRDWSKRRYQTLQHDPYWPIRPPFPSTC